MDREEWRRDWDDVQNHRFDDYWMRGRVHPFLKSFSSRMSGPGAVGLGACGLLVGVTAQSIPFVVISLLFMLVGIANIRKGKRQRKKDLDNDDSVS